MVTLEKLRGDLLTARKARDEVAIGLLNPLLGEAAMIGKNAGNRETTPDEVQRIVKKFLDNARETAAILQKQASNPGTEAVATGIKLNREIALLEAYMPRQMSEDELRAVVEAFKAANPDAKMGDYMAHLKGSYAGQYDGKLASGVVKAALG